MATGWTLDTLLEHVYKLREADLDASNQRFIGQQVAIDKAEDSRDIAIKKSEDSTEKKSDAVYVKLSDLQKALTEVMLRPEIEGRLRAMAKDIKRNTEASNTSRDKAIGRGELITYLLAASAFITFVLKFL